MWTRIWHPMLIMPSPTATPVGTTAILPLSLAVQAPTWPLAFRIVWRVLARAFTT